MCAVLRLGNDYGRVNATPRLQFCELDQLEQNVQRWNLFSRMARLDSRGLLQVLDGGEGVVDQLQGAADVVDQLQGAADVVEVAPFGPCLALSLSIWSFQFGRAVSRSEVDGIWKGSFSLQS